MSSFQKSYTAGYYGKVPSHGDFIGKGLPKRFTQVWDHWLQESMARSKQQLGGQWLDYYLTSPLYRYVLSSGICGDQIWMGVMMPSVDRVGRYFPLTIAQAIDDSVKPISVLNNQQEWFEQSEKLLLSGLEDDFTMQRFSESATEIFESMCTGGTKEKQVVAAANHIGNDLCMVLSQQSSTGATTQLCTSLLLEKFVASYSLWMSHEDGGDSILLLADGLPDYDNFSLLIGNDRDYAEGVDTE